MLGGALRPDTGPCVAGGLGCSPGCAYRVSGCRGEAGHLASHTSCNSDKAGSGQLGLADYTGYSQLFWRAMHPAGPGWGLGEEKGA